VKGEKTTSNTNAYKIFHGKLKKKHLADIEADRKIILNEFSEKQWVKLVKWEDRIHFGL